jgi:catechol 2,3-dioxygenase-like lactoylglutathione lyase family enzyme
LAESKSASGLRSGESAGGIARVDTIGIPSSDTARSREFYVDTLGLRPDEHSWNEFWVGESCFSIWEPARFDGEFRPQANSIVLLHVGDVAAARSALEAKGVEFDGDTFDSGVCHMANFRDPDGNQLTLHKRYAPYGERSAA